MSKLKNMTAEKLQELYDEGHTDASVGSFLGVTGEAIGYWRKKWGLENPKHKVLKGTPVDVLEKDYYSMTTKDFSYKYGVSKVVWLPYLRSLGIVSKYEKRIRSYPELTKDQMSLLIGSLLGDGGISSENRYYESHCLSQRQYAESKMHLLRPFSGGISEDKEGVCFRTIAHPHFKSLRDMFYRKNTVGKMIPVDFIKERWDPRILAYWFLDDGNFDDSTGNFSISNKCPDEKQLREFIDFLNSELGWGFTVHPASGVFLVHMSNSFSKQMSDIIKEVATPDMFYKIPEQYLTHEMVSSSLEGGYKLSPKFYRLSDDRGKQSLESSLVSKLEESGFPFLKMTDVRKEYTLDQFKKYPVSMKGGVIRHNTVGMNLCESFFPNMYRAHRKGRSSPIEDWSRPEYLVKLAKNRLRYADRVTDASLRTGVKLLSSCVSNFRPSVARYIYNRFNANGRTLDYSSGYGSRMLGAMVEGLEYVGIEPNSETASNLMSFGDFLQSRTGGSFRIIHGCSESSDIGEGYGLAFSSPPYFDYEVYCGEESQSLSKYSRYESWMKEYWFATVGKCLGSIVPGGYFGVCLSPLLVQDMIDRTVEKCLSEGFVPWEDFLVPFKGVLAGGDRFEIIMIFRNGGNGQSFKFVGKELPKIVSKAKKPSPHKYRPVYDFEKARAAFIEKSSTVGVSRESYKDDSILGVPSHALEHRFGSWNNFIRSCGLTPQYESRQPVDHVRDYLNACRSSGSALSFYAYEKMTGNPSTRLKRLFNSGKPYNHLKEELKVVALNPEGWDKFLKKFL